LQALHGFVAENEADKLRGIYLAPVRHGRGCDFSFLEEPFGCLLAGKPQR